MNSVAAIGLSYRVLGSWWGNGLPSQSCLVGLRGCPTTRGLRQGPFSVWKQQWRILGNELLLDPVTLTLTKKANHAVKSRVSSVIMTKKINFYP